MPHRGPVREALSSRIRPVAVADAQPLPGSSCLARLGVRSARRSWLVFGRTARRCTSCTSCTRVAAIRLLLRRVGGSSSTAGSGLHAIIASYNQHIQVIQLALDQFPVKTVGLSHYWVNKLFQVLAHLSCAALLSEYARRRLGLITLVLITPFLVFGIGWQYVLWPANVGYTSCRSPSASGPCCCSTVAIGAGTSWPVRCSSSASSAPEFTLVFALGIAVELWLRDRNIKRSLDLAPFRLSSTGFGGSNITSQRKRGTT